MPPSLLELRGISKSFPGVRALDRVDFTLEEGEIHALMGENGAGKSTLIKAFTGVHPPDEGMMHLAGRPYRAHSPAEAQAIGISTVYQEVNLVPDLSVAENLFIGREPRRFGLINWNAMRCKAVEALGRLGLKLDVDRALGSHSIALQQLVAIARAIDLQARVLVLDEPTSSLDKGEVARLFDLVRALKQQGLGIVFVSHFLEQVYTLCDRVTILRNGRLVAASALKDLSRLDLVSAMTGKDHRAIAARASAPAVSSPDAPSVMEANGIARRGHLSPASLSIHRGETVGLAGLLGSGRTEFAELLFGVHRPDAGAVSVDGRPVRITSPRKAMELRIGMLPENRREEGILPRLSVRENIVLALQSRRGWWRPLAPARAQELADEYIRRLGIDTAGSGKPVEFLSGGNQQKVVLARWLASAPALMILDEPTRGIDVGAKGEIEALMRELCADGMAVLFISAEFEELVRDCHRVAVLRDRSKVGELEGESLTVAGILSVIAGGG
jgi:monosaccharide-transporting ATPase